MKEGKWYWTRTESVRPRETIANCWSVMKHVLRRFRSQGNVTEASTARWKDDLVRSPLISNARRLCAACLWTSGWRKTTLDAVLEPRRRLQMCSKKLIWQAVNASSRNRPTYSNKPILYIPRYKNVILGSRGNYGKPYLVALIKSLYSAQRYECTDKRVTGSLCWKVSDKVAYSLHTSSTYSPSCWCL